MQTGARRSLAALTGHPGGPVLSLPDEVLHAIASLTRRIAAGTAAGGRQVVLDAEAELTARGGLPGIRRGGRVSAGGSCRLLGCADGWAAINLTRPHDLVAVPALTQRSDAEPWVAVEAWAAMAPVAEIVARARLLSVPAAGLRTPAVVAVDSSGDSAVGVDDMWPAGRAVPLDRLHIVDLSTMWAGPLAASVLARAGATVTKVESTTRPDGARAVPAFYRRLHAAGQAEVAVDLDRPSGRTAFRELIESADVIVSSSRRRAFEQFNCMPGDLRARPGRVWVAISGYGWRPPGCDRVAFGDDAAVAGGLVAYDAQGDPVFLGDAVADPVTGICAAAAALTALARGGGQFLDVSMAGCAAAVASGETPSAC